MNAKRGIPRRTALAATTAAGLLLLTLILLPDPPARASDSGAVTGSVRPERQAPEVMPRPDGEPKSTSAGARGPVKEKLTARLSALGWSCRADRVAGWSAEGSVTLTRPDGVTLVADEVMILASGEVVGYGLTAIDSELVQMEFNELNDEMEREEGFRIDGDGKVLARHAKLRMLLGLAPGQERPF